jgi:hypothetical protein
MTDTPRFLVRATVSLRVSDEAVVRAESFEPVDDTVEEHAAKVLGYLLRTDAVRDELARHGMQIAGGEVVCEYPIGHITHVLDDAGADES